jgi:hypothetical protein
MHTSNVLSASDFQYWHVDADDVIRVDFDTFCPNYHEFDRIGVVSPFLEDGVLHTGCALLALTTAFYDVLRSRGTDFFDYPHHFALIGANDAGINTRGERLPIDDATIGASWGNLDVWPDSNWIPAPGTALGMVKKVFDLQINRLFWPHDFIKSRDEARLPAYVRDLLKARLKTVYYYNSTAPDWELHVTRQVEDIVRKSVERLPDFDSAAQGQTRPHRVVQTSADNLFYIERYRLVSIDDFLRGFEFAV